jgi:hypothetical protein
VPIDPYRVINAPDVRRRSRRDDTSPSVTHACETTSADIACDLQILTFRAIYATFQASPSRDAP